MSRHLKTKTWVEIGEVINNLLYNKKHHTEIGKWGFLFFFPVLFVGGMKKKIPNLWKNVFFSFIIFGDCLAIMEKVNTNIDKKCFKLNMVGALPYASLYKTINNYQLKIQIYI